MLFDSAKSKNDDKRKNHPRRVMRIAGIAALAIIPLMIAVIGLPQRFTPMSDVPNDDLIYREMMQGYVLDFQTGQRTPTTIPIDLNPELFDWNETSPDGRWRASFDWVELEVTAILRLEDVTGQEPLRVLGTFGGFYSANNLMSWSADQQWLAFSAYTQDPEAAPNTTDQRAEIWITNVTTGESRQLTTNTHMDAEPVFSPDGTQIAYTSDADGTPRVYILDIATGQSRLLTPDQHAINPRWSPDGQWIAYQDLEQDFTEYSAYSNLYVMRVDGTHLQAIKTGEKSVPIIGWKS